MFFEGDESIRSWFFMGLIWDRSNVYFALK